MSTPHPPPPASPPHLDPPFRGYIETTYDSLLVFEAARRGLIPRVTRRLIERERGMVQSGAVFVFDEQESGIKRWTDGLVWSPSRILGNFLVYRETDKRPVNASGNSTGLSGSPNQGSPSSTPSRSMAPPHQYAESSLMGSHATGEIPVLAQGAIRSRSVSEGGMDRQMERQLVGSLTSSYKFKEGGLVKKTMSVSIGNYSQHMISYYTVEDVMAGRLRTPSTIPELASLQINQEYLQQQNFRFPPMIEVGQDGVVRYRGEAEEPMSPNTPMSGLSLHPYPNPSDPFDPFAQVQVSLQAEPPRQYHRGLTPPQHIPLPPPHPHTQSLSPSGYNPPSSSGSQYFDTPYSSLGPASGSTPAQPIPIQRQVSAGGGAVRSSSSGRGRFDPYSTSGSPRVPALGISPMGQHQAYRVTGSSAPGSSGMAQVHRRQSVPHPQQIHQAEYYQQYDVKPSIDAQGVASYGYQPPATAPGSFGEFYSPQHSAPPGVAPGTAYGATGHHHHVPVLPTQQYSAAPAWQSAPTTAPVPGSQSRLLPAQPSPASPYGLLPIALSTGGNGVATTPSSSSSSRSGGGGGGARLQVGPGDFAYTLGSPHQQTVHQPLPPAPLPPHSSSGPGQAGMAWNPATRDSPSLRPMPHPSSTGGGGGGGMHAHSQYSPTPAPLGTSQAGAVDMGQYLGSAGAGDEWHRSGVL